jgi:CelD/BcsL family acetyltransferase involved in cellulose biosynthesis
MLDDGWDELVCAQPRPNPTMLRAWLSALPHGGHGRFTVVRVEQGGRLAAAAALSLFRPLGRGGPTFARWAGDPLLWFNPDLLVRPGLDDAGTALVDTILTRAQALYVPCVADGALARALRGRGRRVLHQWPATEGWVAPIPVPRDGYMRLRVGKDMRRAQRKGVRNEVRIASSSAEIAAALERLFELHHSYWTTRPDYIRRFSATEELRAVNRSLVLALAESGRAFVAQVLEDGEVISTGVSLLAGHGLVTHTSATRRNTVLKEPGYACMLAELDHGAARGATVVDFGAGAGGPATVKGRAGAVEVPIRRVMCARSPGWLQVCRSLVVGRDRAQGARQRLRRRRPASTPRATAGLP